jgi:predicted acylesterase/phospholipase RssA
MNKELKRGLVLEGGGVLGISYIGALRELNKKGYNFKAIVGSSIGSVFALLMACNADFDFVEKYVLNLNVKTLIDNPNSFIGAYRLVHHYGWHNTVNFKKQLQELIKQVTGKDDLTFAEVESIYGKHLAMTSFSLQAGYNKVFNPNDTPNMSVIDACIHSCNVPLFFMTTGYLDGGLLDNYPIAYMNTLLGPDKTLGLTLYQPNVKYVMPANLYDFIKCVAEIVINQAFKLHLHEADKKNTVQINISSNVSFLNFDLTAEDKTVLINDGAKAMQAL